jgi:hypothetical protein
MLPTKRDLIEQGKNRLKSQWQDKAVINGLLESFLIEIQKLEDSAEFLKNISINNSFGEDLDRIGRLWNVQREGRPDDEYRAVILTFVSTIDPDISPEGLLEALRSYGQTDQVQIHEHFPAFIQMYMGDGFTTNMKPVLDNIRPAGVGISLFVDDNGDSIVFQEEFLGSQILVTDEGKGIVLDDDSGIDKLWAVDNFLVDDGSEFFSELAEEGDNNFHPFAEEINREIIVSSGNLIDNELEEVVDYLNGNIVYVDYKFKV